MQNNASWTQLVSVFLANCQAKNLSPNTIVWYRLRIKDMMERMGSTPAEITLPMLRAAVSEVISNGNSRTAKHNVTAIKTFFKFLFEEGYIDSNPAIRLECVKVPNTLITPFTPDNVKTLLALPKRRRFAGDRDYTAMIMLFDTGLRITELISIKLEDIDWSTNMIKVMGKGSKERMVPFGKTAHLVLRQYIARRGDLEHNWLFVSELGEKIQDRVLQECFTRYGQLAGITSVRVSPHTFRHTFAVEAVRAGMDIFALQRILGHTSLDMVRRYVHLVTDDLQKAHQKYGPLDRLLMAPKPEQPRKRLK